MRKSTIERQRIKLEKEHLFFAKFEGKLAIHDCQIHAAAFMYCSPDKYVRQVLPALTEIRGLIAETRVVKNPEFYRNEESQRVFGNLYGRIVAVSKSLEDMDPDSLLRECKADALNEISMIIHSITFNEDYELQVSDLN